MDYITTPLRQSKSQHQMFSTLCDRSDRSMNEVINQLVREYINKHWSEVIYRLGVKWVAKGKRAMWILSVQSGAEGPTRVLRTGFTDATTIEEVRLTVSKELGGTVVLIPGSDSGDDE